MDQFYTTPAQAMKCWSFMHSGEFDIPEGAFYVEPSAGMGAFYKLMPEGRRLGFDIDPRCEGVIEQDFLQSNPLFCEIPSLEPVVFVGNPPFGKRGALARAFIEKCFELGAEYVGMILPPAFRPYDDGEPPFFERGLNKLCHSVGFLDVDKRYLLPDGGAHNVENCSFVVYKRGCRPAGRAAASCDSYASVCYIENRPPERVSGLDRLGKADVYLTNSYTPRSLDDHTELPPEVMAYAFTIHRDRERVKAFLMGYDWSKMDKRLNGAPRINVSTLKRVLVDAGFVDEPADELGVETLTIHDYGPHDPADCYLQKSFFKERPPSIVSDINETKYGNCKAIYIRRGDKARVLEALRAVNWLDYARPAANKSYSITHSSIMAALRDAGIELPDEEPADCVEVYNLSPPKAGRSGWGLDKAARCALFLPQSHYGKVKPQTTPFNMTSLGLEIKSGGKEVLDFALRFDWGKIGRKSVSGCRTMSKQDVKKAFRSAGFTA